jgi:uncharacterized membrane protein
MSACDYDGEDDPSSSISLSGESLKMKKLTTLMLGTALVFGTATATFAADDKKAEKKADKKEKKEKKKDH